MCRLELHGQERGLSWRKPWSPQAVKGVMNESTSLEEKPVQTHGNREATEPAGKPNNRAPEGEEVVLTVQHGRGHWRL